ncbi:MAG: hypothetical protein KAI72_02245, partial [Candidatus Pacebacteria bacterium]|nr:hypothetical protein [Candidatus Paceibacterota bacterium]
QRIFAGTTGLSPGLLRDLSLLDILFITDHRQISSNYYYFVNDLDLPHSLLFVPLYSNFTII